MKRLGAVAAGVRMSGFTLLELLVVITLFGVITVLLLNAVRLGTRVWETVSARADASERLRVAYAFIGRRLEQAQPLYETDARGTPRISFAGTTDAMSFVAPLQDYLQQGGMYQFKLQVKEQDGVRHLVVRIELFQSGDWERFGTGEIYGISLYEDIEQVEFAYFGEKGAMAEPMWHGDWHVNDRLPRLIRVRIRPRSDHAGQWPDLLVEPKTGIDMVTGRTLSVQNAAPERRQ